MRARALVERQPRFVVAHGATASYRIRVLEVLVDGDKSVAQLLAIVLTEQSHLSQQLGVLRRAGLVSARKERSSAYYSLRDPLVAELLSVAKRLLSAQLSETRDLLAGLAAPSAG